MPSFVPTQRPWFRKSLNLYNNNLMNYSDTIVTGLYADAITDQPTLTFSKLILGFQGQLVGVICLDILNLDL